MSSDIEYTSVPDFQAMLRKGTTVLLVLSGPWCRFCKEQAADMAAASPPLPLPFVFVDVGEWNAAFSREYRVDIAPVTFVATPSDGAFMLGKGKLTVDDLRRACEAYGGPALATTAGQ